MTEELFQVYENLAEGGVGAIVTGTAYISNLEKPLPQQWGFIRLQVFFRVTSASSSLFFPKGCMICKTYTYPEKACRFPERMLFATEGFGILIMQQAQEYCIKYNNGPYTLSYFSMIFF